MLFIYFFIWLFTSTEKLNYTILPSSKVQLELNTNLAKVHCKCLENFNFAKPLSFEFENQPNQIKTKNTTLVLEVSKINCKNKGINQDLRESLNAQRFPHIEFEIQQINVPLKKVFKSQPAEVITFITISGKKLPQKIKTTITPLGADKYRITAKQELSLNAYEISPKSTLKFVKIYDKATVSIDLHVQIFT